jgi:hypothetical protein
VRLGAPPDLSARFTFVTPNLCHDMHDCSLATGDRWLAGFVPRVLASAQYRSGGTALFITWDEDDGSSANLIPTLVIAPHTRPGTRSAQPFSHYSLPRSMRAAFGL